MQLYSIIFSIIFCCCSFFVECSQRNKRSNAYELHIQALNNHFAEVDKFQLHEVDFESSNEKHQCEDLLDVDFGTPKKRSRTEQCHTAPTPLEENSIPSLSRPKITYPKNIQKVDLLKTDFFPQSHSSIPNSISTITTIARTNKKAMIENKKYSMTEDQFQTSLLILTDFNNQKEDRKNTQVLQDYNIVYQKYSLLRKEGEEAQLTYKSFMENPEYYGKI